MSLGKVARWAGAGLAALGLSLGMSGVLGGTTTSHTTVRHSVASKSRMFHDTHPRMFHDIQLRMFHDSKPRMFHDHLTAKIRMFHDIRNRSIIGD